MTAPTGGWAAAPPPPPPPPGYYYAPPQPQPSRGSPVAIVAVFLGFLLLIAAVVALVVLLSQPPPPVAPCDQEIPCTPPPSGRPVSNTTPRPGTSGVPGTPAPPVASPTGPAATATPVGPTPGPGQATPGPGQATPGPGEPTPFPPVPTPTSDSPPALAGALLRNETLGFSFEYRGDHWVLGDSGDTENRIVLNGVLFDAQVIIDVAPASVSTAEMIASQLALADRFTLGRAPDTDSYDAVLGPSIGYIRGEVGVFSGTLLDRNGTPIEPVGITVLSSSNGRITVGVMVIAGQPDARLGPETHQYAVRQSTDLVLKTFNWGPTL